MKEKDRNSLLFVALAIFVFIVLFPQTRRMRPKDVERLQAEAEAGNLKSMEVLMAHGDGVAPDSLLMHYTEVLAKAGNYKALAFKFMQENKGNASWEVFRDKKETGLYIKWMKKGAEKGDPDCMYQLAGEYSRKDVAANAAFVPNPYHNSDLAWKWTQQAADSCLAFARNSLKYRDRTVNVLSRPRLASTSSPA